MVGELTPAPPPLNPWRTIWFSPRQTIRAIVDSDERPSLVPVVGIAFIAVFLNLVNTVLSAPPIWRSLLRAVALVFSAMTAYFASGPIVLAWYGRKRNAVGGRQEIRQALAWGYAPIAVSAVCWVPLWIATDGSTYDYDISLPPVLRVLTLPLFFAADWVAPIWNLAMTVVMLSEVQRRSAWQAIDSIIIAWLVGLLGLALMAVVLNVFM